MFTLNSLLKKNVHFKWSNKCEKSFRLLIDSLIREAVLCYQNFDGELLQVDALNKSLGYVLSQEKSGSDTAIAFGVHILNIHEVCYSEKECLAVLSGVKHFHHYLFGC